MQSQLRPSRGCSWSPQRPVPGAPCPRKSVPKLSTPSSGAYLQPSAPRAVDQKGLPEPSMSSWRRTQGPSGPFLTGRDLGAPRRGWLQGGEGVTGCRAPAGWGPGTPDMLGYKCPPIPHSEADPPVLGDRHGQGGSPVKTPPPPAETSPGRGGTTVAPAVPVQRGCPTAQGARSCGTHKPCGESWAWGPRGAKGPGESCVPGAPAQACSPGGARWGQSLPCFLLQVEKVVTLSFGCHCSPRHPSILGALAPEYVFL